MRENTSSSALSSSWRPLIVRLVHFGSPLLNALNLMHFHAYSARLVSDAGNPVPVRVEVIEAFSHNLK